MWHGQHYDGCSTMAGARGDVAAREKQIELIAVALNLSVNDTMNGSAAMS